MKRAIVTALFIIVFFILQASVFQHIAFNGIVPNILIILTASYGFMRSDKSGLIVGFICGILVDIFFGDILGFNAVLYMYIGYANGKFSGMFYPDDYKLPAFLIVLSDFFYNLLTFAIRFLLRGRFEFKFYLVHIMIPEIVYTIVVGLILYPLIMFVDKRFFSDKLWSED